MPRRPRFDEPGVPQHVIQRGNNRMPMFTATEEYEAFARWLGTAVRRYDCHVHAYVFMTNHVHFLMTPFHHGAMGRVMQMVGRLYVRYFNERHGRTGTLWEGRYRSTPVDTDRYFMACHRYIELNPVRAGLTNRPADYRWSSHTANAFGAQDLLVSPHPLYLSLAGSPNERRVAYRALFRSAIEADMMQRIRSSIHAEWPLGSDAYRLKVGMRLDRQTSPTRRSRQVHSDPQLLL